MTAIDDPVTTVKVPRSLRERISRDAAANGQTAAVFLGSIVDRWERERRMADVRRAYDHTDREYLAETEAWEATSADGMDD